MKATSIAGLWARAAGDPYRLLISAVIAHAAMEARRRRRAKQCARRQRLQSDALEFLNDPTVTDLAAALGVDLAGWLAEGCTPAGNMTRRGMEVRHG